MLADGANAWWKTLVTGYPHLLTSSGGREVVPLPDLQSINDLVIALGSALGEVEALELHKKGRLSYDSRPFGGLGTAGSGGNSYRPLGRLNNGARKPLRTWGIDETASTVLTNMLSGVMGQWKTPFLAL